MSHFKLDIAIHLNDIIKVKLNTDGLRIHREWYEALTKNISGGTLPRYAAPTTDSKGYAEFTLWQLMQIFGPTMHLAGSAPWEDGNILFEVR